MDLILVKDINAFFGEKGKFALKYWSVAVMTNNIIASISVAVVV